MKFKLFGIESKIHWSWWIFVLINCSSSILTLNFSLLVIQIWIHLVMLFTVIGHEYSHALMARKYGYETNSIVMHILGGVALIDIRNPKPHEEFWISLAGPLFNFVIFILTFLVACIISPFNILSTEVGITLLGKMFYPIMICNLFVGIFNLLPFYPLDGGRIFRSILTTFIGIEKSKDISHTVGFIGAGLFFALAFYLSNPMFVLLAFFLVFIIFAERREQNS